MRFQRGGVYIFFTGIFDKMIDNIKNYFLFPRCMKLRLNNHQRDRYRQTEGIAQHHTFVPLIRGGNSSFYTALCRLLLCCVLSFLFTETVAAEKDSVNRNSTLVPFYDTLPSRIPKMDRPYHVTQTIKIPAGTEVIIEKGVVFLFEDFTGIEVKGRLIARGTKEEPIVFTSDNDTAYNPGSSIEPAPFDWDGISIDQNSTLALFENCVIQYSLFGIKSLSDSVVIASCQFKQNGQSDVSINGKSKTAVSPDFSFNTILADQLTSSADDSTPSSEHIQDSIAIGSVDLAVKTDTSLTEKSVSPLVSPVIKNKKTRTVRIISGAISIAGGIAGGLAMYHYIPAKQEFDEINSFSQEAKMKFTSKQWEDSRHDAARYLTYMSLGYSIALTGLTIFVITF